MPACLPICLSVSLLSAVFAFCLVSILILLYYFSSVTFLSLLPLLACPPNPHLLAYLPVYLPVCFSPCLSASPSPCLSSFPPPSLSFFLLLSLSAYLFVCLSLSVCLLVHFLICSAFLPPCISSVFPASMPVCLLICFPVYLCLPAFPSPRLSAFFSLLPYFHASPPASMIPCLLLVPLLSLPGAVLSSRPPARHSRHPRVHQRRERSRLEVAKCASEYAPLPLRFQELGKSLMCTLFLNLMFSSEGPDSFKPRGTHFHPRILLPSWRHQNLLAFLIFSSSYPILPLLFLVS